MKKILLSLSVFIFMFACKPAEIEVVDISLSGKIENATGDTLMLRKNGEVEKFGLAEDGTFSGTVKGGAGYYDLRYKRNGAKVYLTPGETVLNTDLNTFDSTLAFSGIGATVNNYLKSKSDLGKNFDEELAMKDLFSLDENGFLEVMNKREKAYTDQMLKAGLPPDFVITQGKNIKYEFINLKQQMFESYHQYFAKDEDFKVSDTYNKQFENLNFTNESDFLSIPEYNSLVMANYTDGELPECLEKLASVESKAIKDEVLKMLNSYYLSPGIEDLKGSVDKMKALTTNSELLEDLDESFTKMNALAKGNVSPGFEYKNVKGANVNLKDLKGKNVYIDVWATWCGPCKAEIPHLKELEKSYHGKNVEFVSISVDVPDDEEKWKTMVADQELQGVQLLSDNGWDTKFVKDYLINGIPRFILLDAEGKIVTADAPRPSSDKELTDMINTLL
jgi:thiol-disulfide isomerase/thioredoxin